MKGTSGSAAAVVLMALLLLLALTGCGKGAPVGSGDSGGSRSPEPQTRLTIRVQPGDDAPNRTWTLTCEPAGGSHPTPQAACDALQAADDPFTPVPPDAICTQIYGGPQQATVEGHWQGDRVHAAFNRKNGCEIHRWESVKPVLQPHEPSTNTAPEDQ